MKKAAPPPGNPFYRGASPEEVARALLQRAPKKPKAPDPPKPKRRSPDD